MKRPEFATRTKQRARQQIQQNRFVIIGAGAIVPALLIFVATSMPSRRTREGEEPRCDIEGRVGRGNHQKNKHHSLFPITDSGRPEAAESGSCWSQEEQGTVSKLGMPTEAFTLWIKGLFAVT